MESVFLLTFVIILSTLSGSACGIAVMSVDLGTEWMKVAIVSPGVPMEIALNHESQRKTPVTVAFRDNERYFADPAATIGVRFPEKSYAYILDLLAKRLDNPMVQLFQRNFPYYKLSADDERGTVILHHPDGMTFTPEEIIAMILKHAEEIASTAAGQQVKDAVITVPPYFNQAERRALLRAADMAGINVLQLINSNLAVALNYGIFRRKDFNETPTNILFYDMGAGSTVATVASYQLTKSKDKSLSETNPGVVIKGIGFDRTLGGLAMQLKLRDYLAESFNKQKKTKNIFKNSRAMAKLLKEAGRVKKVLSANADHVAQVESLLNDIDFKQATTREEFDSLCDDLFQRVGNPVKMALESAGITLDEIDQVILAGAATRTPKVQQKLLEIVGKSELGKSINTDEAAALGAAYQAAYLSKGFKVKTFLIKDSNLYPIQIDFQREIELEDGSPGIKLVKRTLFNRNNPFPQKKIMTFNRHMKDFSFSISYAELNFLPNLELKSLGGLNLSEVSLNGVQQALSKHNDDNTEAKGVKAHFLLDDSGLLQLDHVECVFDKKVEEIEEPTNLESTLAKLGSTIGKLFSGDTDKTREKDADKEKSEQDTESKEKTEKADLNSEEPESKEKTNESKPEAGQNTTESAKNEKNDTQDKTEKKGPKVITVKEPILINSIQTDLPDMTSEKLAESRRKLKELDEKSQKKLANEKAKNALESFILESKNKLFTEEYEKAAKEQELTEILKRLNEEGDWLDYESQDAATEVFKDKLSELKLLTRNIFERVQEHRDRPEALKALNEMLNMSNLFLTNALKIPKDDQIFTEVEINTLEKLINETESWKTHSEEEQSKTSLSDTPKLTIKSIAEKIAALDREVKYLLNKARFAVPKTKSKSENLTDSETVNDASEKETNDTKAKDKTGEEANTEAESKSESNEPTEEDILQLEESHPETSKDSIDESTKPSPDKSKKQDHTEL